MGAVWGGACAGSASSDAAPSRGYRRREPERTLLHATVRAHWKTFLAEMEERGEAGASPPRVVGGGVERYLGGGILAKGVAREGGGGGTELRLYLLLPRPPAKWGDVAPGSATH